MAPADPQHSQKGQESRDRLINAAASLMQSRGYHAMGMSDVVETSGAPRGSLYFYFPRGKEALACVAIDAIGATWRRELDETIRAAPDLPAAMRDVCRRLGQILVSSGYAQGCPVATVGLESAVSSEAIRHACATHFSELTKIITGHLRSALQTRGAGRTRASIKATADAFAILILSAIEGALLLCKVGHTLTPLDNVAASLEELLRQLLAGRFRNSVARRNKRSRP